MSDEQGEGTGVGVPADERESIWIPQLTV